MPIFGKEWERRDPTKWVICEKCGVEDKTRWIFIDGRRKHVTGTREVMRCPDCGGEDVNDPRGRSHGNYVKLCRECCPSGHGTNYQSEYRENPVFPQEWQHPGVEVGNYVQVIGRNNHYFGHSGTVLWAGPHDELFEVGIVRDPASKRIKQVNVYAYKEDLKVLSKDSRYLENPIFGKEWANFKIGDRVKVSDGSTWSQARLRAGTIINQNLANDYFQIKLDQDQGTRPIWRHQEDLRILPPDEDMSQYGEFNNNPVYPEEWRPRPVAKFNVGDPVVVSDKDSRFHGVNGSIVEVLYPRANEAGEMEYNVDFSGDGPYSFCESQLSDTHGFANNPIYPTEWTPSDFDPSKFYNLKALKREVTKDIMGFKPTDLEVEDDTFSIWVDTIASGALGIHIPSRAAKFFGLSFKKVVPEDERNGAKGWDDYDFASDVIDEYAEKVAKWLNEASGMPGKFHFGYHPSDGDYGLEYVWHTGDHPDFDARR